MVREETPASSEVAEGLATALFGTMIETAKAQTYHRNVTGMVFESLHALFFPAGTSPTIVARIHREVDRFLRSPDGRDQFIKGGVEAVSSTPEQLTATMKSEMATIGKVLKAAGVTPP